MSTTTTADRDNPFVADDILIRVGVTAFVAALLLHLVIARATGPLLPLVPAVLIAGIGLAAFSAGLRLRSREKKAIRLLNLLERFPEISVDQLLNGSRLSRADIERAVATVNERGLHFVVWDRRSDTLVDGRLAAGSVTVDDCPECGAGIGLTVSLVERTPARCPYCQSGVSDGALDSLKQARLSALDAERARERARRVPTSTPLRLEVHSAPTGKRFSVWLFLALLVFVTPLGIGYGLYHAVHRSR